MNQPIIDPFRAPKRQFGEPGRSMFPEPVRRIKTPRIANGAVKTGIRGGDWFGCGRVITTESWERFLKARALCYAELDAQEKHLNR